MEWNEDTLGVATLSACHVTSDTSPYEEEGCSVHMHQSDRKPAMVGERACQTEDGYNWMAHLFHDLSNNFWTEKAVLENL